MDIRLASVLALAFLAAGVFLLLARFLKKEEVTNALNTKQITDVDLEMSPEATCTNLTEATTWSSGEATTWSSMTEATPCHGLTVISPNTYRYML